MRKFKPNEYIIMNEDNIFEKCILVKTGSKYKTDNSKEKPTLIDYKYKFILDKYRIYYGGSGYDKKKYKGKTSKELNEIYDTQGYFYIMDTTGEITGIINKKVKLHRYIYCLEHKLELKDIDGFQIHHNGVKFDSRSRNLILAKNDKVHSRLENISIEWDEDLKKYRISESVYNLHWYLKKNTRYQLIGDLPEPNEDIDAFSEEVEKYFNNNRKIFDDYKLSIKKYED